jgi:thiol:disulfide interchange protein
VSGILSLGGGEGVRFAAAPGAVPEGGEPVGAPAAAGASLWLLLAGAFAGGLLLNLMPCVFPILSLKALTLARAGESEAGARREGLAYTGGVVLACVALGALLLALRAGGSEIGWAFQLQEPGVVVALLVLAVAITANFAGLYELPSLSITCRGRTSAFATGLLAAFVATPCTGPFMAAALGAALLLPWAQALLLFAALGLGLALPFLLLGFVPPLRRVLPRPGPWMETFRRVLAVPMGLTALALLWLAWRLGGGWFAVLGLVIAVQVVLLLVALRGGGGPRALLAGAAGVVALVLVPQAYSPPAAAAESVLEPTPFSEAALAEARAANKPVFLWFTADWCLTCKVNENLAIERDSTRDAFEQAGVVAMRGDWTRRDPAITRFLTDHGAAGVPLYLWYPAGGEGKQLPQVLKPDSLVELATAG